MLGIKKTGLFALFFLVFSFRAFAAIPSPVGNWITIDDMTHKPRSVVKLWVDSKGHLTGKIIKIDFRPGENAKDVCNKCTDPEHRNKRILGMTIVWGLSEDKSVPLRWTNGKILDPEDGRIYGCNITVSPDGKTIDARGYLGVSLLGRSQLWLRAHS